jgi:hypothetical protein
MCWASNDYNILIYYTTLATMVDSSSLRMTPYNWGDTDGINYGNLVAADSQTHIFVNNSDVSVNMKLSNLLKLCVFAHSDHIYESTNYLCTCRLLKNSLEPFRNLPKDLLQLTWWQTNILQVYIKFLNICLDSTYQGLKGRLSHLPVICPDIKHYICSLDNLRYPQAIHVAYIRRQWWVST